jgi:Uma2 family endonuclease
LSFPLIGEIASPDDSAEDLFEKAYEYLASGAAEVWILLPESKVALIVLADRVLAFSGDQQIATQKVLLGFAIALSELFA